MIGSSNPYISARKSLLEELSKELLGPGSEVTAMAVDEEIISEPPIDRYAVGILYPQKTSVSEEVDLDADNTVSDRVSAEEIVSDHVSLANQYYPSAMGISFYAQGISPGVTVGINAAVYRKVNFDDECVIFIDDLSEDVTANPEFKAKIQYSEGKLVFRGDFSKNDREDLLRLSSDKFYQNAIHKLYRLRNYGWKRFPVVSRENKIKIDPETKCIRKPLIDGLELVCISRPDRKQNRTLFTISLVNTFVSDKQRNNEKSFFQVGFDVERFDGSEGIFLEYEQLSRLVGDTEALLYHLLYRNRKQFATGHGCAVGWEEDDNLKAKRLFTLVIPSCEVPNITFDIEELAGEVSQILEMKTLSDWTDLNRQEMADRLYNFCRTYKEWAEGLCDKHLSGVPDILKDVAHSHIGKCIDTYQRMKKGVDILNADDIAFRAFLLANRVMFMQLIHFDIQKTKRFPEDPDPLMPDYENTANPPKWRPFQLAFLLLNINSLVNQNNPEHDIVDLIWFPTGGGKTEAYLGISAFVIFLRRFRSCEKSGGTAILMRYTLRLLTSQQFQRATTLICACELVRREFPEELGDEPISIGLWVGLHSTPNTIQTAIASLQLLIGGDTTENPFQLFSCPWCGTKMVKEVVSGATGKIRKGKWGYREGRRPKRLTLYCPEKTCAFHDGLPVKIVDEEIYKTPPTILFGTVDKFALLPWKGDVANIFGLGTCSSNLPPELIIQDELHLISGPLGTMVGLYETAIDTLCSSKGIRPKIIASTATIRRADDQCKALYNRSISQFPSPGLDISDSFFTREVTVADKPGRLFVGIMSSGKTHVTTIIRFMAAILQIVEDLDAADDVKNAYWTLVGYYNTLRELGHNVTMVNDDVKAALKVIADRKNRQYRRIYEPEELTSRRKATEIPEILEKLQVNYPNPHAVQVLLATNMISTGVDIDRFGLMMVAGQPKATAEYIQATSRIGRRYPGLVFTIYNGSKPRDRSHYEHFIAYHQAFYRYVEPTTVTPFSGPARERALHSVIISCIRHLFGFSNDKDAKEILRDGMDKKLTMIKNIILQRVKSIDAREEEKTMLEIEGIIARWKERARDFDDLHFGSLGSDKYRNSDEVVLMSPAGQEKGEFNWETLTSMRSVDADCRIRIIENDYE